MLLKVEEMELPHRKKIEEWNTFNKIQVDKSNVGADQKNG